MNTAINATTLKLIIKAVKPLLPPDFFGRIELNVQAGGVSNVNVLQSFKSEAGDEWAQRT